MIWVIGAKGMLGSAVCAALKSKAIPYTGTGREVDITQKDALFRFIKSNPGIGWIVNCAAYTAVEKAEDEPEKCRAINALGAENLAGVAMEEGAGFVHISTDYVFDGTLNRPYREDDAPGPLGVYGKSKLESEERVLLKNKSAYILRTAWLYGEGGANFVRTMLRLANEQKKIRVVADQKGCPTWTRDLAMVISACIEKNGALQPGIYHYTHEGICSWFEFAQKIFEYAAELNLINGIPCLEPCATSEYPSRVRRPACTPLDKQKIKTALNIDIPRWEGRLRLFLEKQK
jgi:dTDP-4-dehydrorhamnose reductase